MLMNRDFYLILYHITRIWNHAVNVKEKGCRDIVLLVNAYY